jgi:hypothetical protein
VVVGEVDRIFPGPCRVVEGEGDRISPVGEIDRIYLGPFRAAVPPEVN